MAETRETLPVLGDTDEPRQEEPVDKRASENAEGRTRVNFTRNLNKESDASIAKKMFFGGLAFLPWLHILNVFHYRKYLLDATKDPQATMWVRRSFVSCSIVTVVFAIWILIFQLKWREYGWSKLIMNIPDTELYTGW
uniref:Uncharacterized protein AlNc14C238G9424 n=1 Tax=Albugo laibachii Nc14 TaxID=890382 RepID=F0WSS8_9STRA|nr:conserved hypothetical protein [Albugo laibachii Nc14]|eukprot:CCA24406.1 conserved hypothetical protein [Albugo laibachii Nc14]